MKRFGKLVLLFLVLKQGMFAQIYNYDPIRHTNFETNPSYLAAAKSKGMLSYMHQGKTLIQNTFAYDELKTSIYFPKHFCGAGLVFNNTKINDTASYRYVAIGAAYRNVLFNVIHTRIGFLYKQTQFNCDHLALRDYGYSNTVYDLPKVESLQNANISISFASSRETIYISFALLNLPLSATKEQYELVAPRYYVVNIGDLGKALNWDETSIAFTSYIKRAAIDNENCYYIHIAQKGVAISRENQFVYGLTAGYSSGEYFQIKPSLSFVNSKLVRRISHHRKVEAEKNVVKLLYDFSCALRNRERSYTPSLQMSLTHFF